MALLYRNDGWVKAVLGPAIAGAEIFVCNQPASLTNPPTPLATIYSDVNGVSPITQPIFTDGFGHYSFYASSGFYTVVVVNAGQIQQVYTDQTVGVPGVAGGGTVTNASDLGFGQVVTGDGGDGVQTSGTLLSSLATSLSVAAETVRAEAAEALLAPLASPTFSGMVVAPGVNNVEYVFSGGNAGAKINAAFALASVVVLAGGTYTATSQISVPANCQLRLQQCTLQVNAAILMANSSSIVGIGKASVIQSLGMNATTQAVITNLGNSGLNETTATANSDILVEKIYINAVSAGNTVTTLEGLWLSNCSNSTARDVYVTGCKGGSGGVRFYGGAGNLMDRCIANACAYIGLSQALGTTWTMSNCRAIGNGDNGIDCGIGTSQGRVVNCESTGNGANGFNPDTCSDIQVLGGNFSGNTQYGIAVTNSQLRVSIVGARCYGNTLAGMLINNNSNYVTISGCIVAANGTHGIWLNAVSNVTVSGNVIIDNGATTPNTYDGVHIQSSGGTAENNIINANLIANIASANQRYGVDEDTTGGGTVGQSTLTSNNVFGNATSAFSILQTTTVAMGNRLDGTGVFNLYSNTSATATPGAIVPSNFQGYIEVALAGATVKIPYLNA